MSLLGLHKLKSFGILLLITTFLSSSVIAGGFIVNSISINDGDKSSIDTNVMVGFATKSPVSLYRISEHGKFSGANWQYLTKAQLLSNEIDFTLSDGAGTKTIYFQIADGSPKAPSSLSNIVSSSIILEAVKEEAVKEEVGKEEGAKEEPVDEEGAKEEPVYEEDNGVDGDVSRPQADLDVLVGRDYQSGGVAYQITLTNNGPEDISSGVVKYSKLIDGQYREFNRIAFDLLANGATRQENLSIDGSNSASYKIEAWIIDESDPDNSNNSKTVHYTTAEDSAVASDNIQARRAERHANGTDLEVVSIELPQSMINPGVNNVIQVVVRNNGPEYVSDESAQVSLTIGDYTNSYNILGSFHPGDSKTLQLTNQWVPGSVGTYSVVYSVAIGGPDAGMSDTNPGNNSKTASIEVTNPILYPRVNVVSFTGSPENNGELFAGSGNIIEIEVSNNEPNARMDALTLNVNIGVGLDANSSENDVWSSSRTVTVSPGQTERLRFENVSLPSGGDYHVKAEIQMSSEANISDPSQLRSVYSASVAQRTADLRIISFNTSKSIFRQSKDTDMVITFINDGPHVAEHVTLYLKTTTGAGHPFVANSVYIGSLEPGQEIRHAIHKIYITQDGRHGFQAKIKNLDSSVIDPGDAPNGNNRKIRYFEVQGVAQ